MSPLLLIGVVLIVALLYGKKGMRALGRIARRNWRPGAAVMSLALFTAAAASGVHKSWPLSIGLLIAGLVTAMGVRKAPHPGQGTARPAPPAPRGGMTLSDARSILGVSGEATDEEVQAAYLRLIRRAHPDQGGTAGLAAQLNAARDTLLKKG